MFPLSELTSRLTAHFSSPPRDVLSVAALFPANANDEQNTNYALCQSVLKAIRGLPKFSVFSEKLTGDSLALHGTSMSHYLRQTGRPPMDLSTIEDKLRQSNKGRSAKPYEYVQQFLEDLLSVVLNALAFNPPSHPFHTLALELGEQLILQYIPELRKGLKVQSEDEVCILCGSDVSTHDNLLVMCDSRGGCGLWFHCRCEGIALIPDSQYTCRACKAMKNRIKEYNSANSVPHSSSHSVKPHKVHRRPSPSNAKSAAAPSKPQSPQSGNIQREKDKDHDKDKQSKERSGKKRKHSRPSSGVVVPSSSGGQQNNPSSFNPASSNYSLLEPIQANLNSLLSVLHDTQRRFIDYSHAQALKEADEADERVAMDARKEEIAFFREYLKNSTAAASEANIIHMSAQQRLLDQSKDAIADLTHNLAIKEAELVAFRHRSAMEMKTLQHKVNDLELAFKDCEAKLHYANLELREERVKANQYATELNHRTKRLKAIESELIKKEDNNNSHTNANASANSSAPMSSNIAGAADEAAQSNGSYSRSLAVSERSRGGPDHRSPSPKPAASAPSGAAPAKVSAVSSAAASSSFHGRDAASVLREHQRKKANITMDALNVKDGKDSKDSNSPPLAVTTINQAATPSAPAVVSPLVSPMPISPSSSPVLPVHASAANPTVIVSSVALAHANGAVQSALTPVPASLSAPVTAARSLADPPVDERAVSPPSPYLRYLEEKQKKTSESPNPPQPGKASDASEGAARVPAVIVLD